MLIHIQRGTLQPQAGWEPESGGSSLGFTVKAVSESAWGLQTAVGFAVSCQAWRSPSLAGGAGQGRSRGGRHDRARLTDPPSHQCGEAAGAAQGPRCW